MKTTPFRLSLLAAVILAGIGAWAPAGECADAEAAETAGVRRRVGLVAHDGRKPELLAWVERNAALLAEQELFCTGTTGGLVARTLAAALPGKEIRLTRFNSGPLGGDQQMGALIAENGLDILVFLVDPLASHPHEADVRALLRLCAVHNTVLATTASTADFVIASPHFTGGYAIARPEYPSRANQGIK